MIWNDFRRSFQVCKRAVPRNSACIIYEAFIIYVKQAVDRQLAALLASRVAASVLTL